MVPFDPTPPIQAAGILLLIAAACSDVVRRIVPDWVSIALVVLGLLAGLVRGPSSLLGSIAAAVLLFLLLTLLHARGALGGGDVKLASAVALLLPFGALAGFVELTAIAGGVLALLHLALRPFAPRLSPVHNAPLARRVLAAECWRLRRRGSIPYGVAIACGGAIMLLGGS